MRTIRVSLKTIRAAIARAQTVSDDWQAQLCEIALIPAVAKRWKELNSRLPGLAITRHDGAPHIGMTPYDNRAVTDWTVYAGYVLIYFPESGKGWNSVRDNYYCHSPSSAWNGIRRETVSQFLEDLRMVALGYTNPEIMRSLERAKIVVTGLPAQAAA